MEIKAINEKQNEETIVHKEKAARGDIYIYKGAHPTNHMSTKYLGEVFLDYILLLHVNI